MEKKYVTVGITDGTYIEIKEGLKEGDKVKAMSEFMSMMMSMYGSDTSGGSVTVE